MRPLLALALVLACGGGPPPPPEAPPPAPPQKSGLDGVRERGVLRVAADPDAAPFLAKNATGGWEGFEYAIMAAIADEAGVPVTIVPAQFFQLRDKLAAGEADVIIGQLSPSSAYEDLVFSTSYLQYSFCLVVPKTSKVKGLGDLRGKKVAMYDDPVARQLAEVLIGGTYEAVHFDDYGYFEKLVRGQLDAMVYDCPLARYEMKTFGDALVVADDALNVATYNVGVRKDDPTMLADVDRVLQELGNAGLLAKLGETWLADTAPAADIQTASGRVVVVKRGDTLSLIAAREMGNAESWRKLYDANKDVVGPDVNVIYQGMRLRIPQ